jgi:hypothetical protein
MEHLAFAPALSLASKIRHKDISARELLEFYLQRVEHYNPRLNAIIFRQDEKAWRRPQRRSLPPGLGGASGPHALAPPLWAADCRGLFARSDLHRLCPPGGAGAGQFYPAARLRLSAIVEEDKKKGQGTLCPGSRVPVRGRATECGGRCCRTAAEPARWPDMRLR